jgi:Pentapeptide repeats (8 copies)
MANQDHLDVLKQGIAVWNTWRKEHPDIQPDLSGANLTGADLGLTDLSGANLRGANLTGANLTDALQLHLFGGRWFWSHFDVWLKAKKS